MGRGESNGAVQVAARPQLTEAQIANRKAGPPSLDEVKVALHSDAQTPKLCSKYGIPVELIRRAEATVRRYPAPERAMYRRVIEYLYPVGTRIRLEEPMVEEQNPSVNPGDQGTVRSIDDSPTLHVDWDHGPRLGLVIGIDKFSVVEG